MKLPQISQLYDIFKPCSLYNQYGIGLPSHPNGKFLGLYGISSSSSAGSGSSSDSSSSESSRSNSVRACLRSTFSFVAALCSKRSKDQIESKHELRTFWISGILNTSKSERTVGRFTVNRTI